MEPSEMAVSKDGRRGVYRMYLFVYGLCLTAVCGCGGYWLYLFVRLQPPSQTRPWLAWCLVASGGSYVVALMLRRWMAVTGFDPRGTKADLSGQQGGIADAK